MSIHPPRHHGRYPAPRLRLRPAFIVAIIATFQDGARMPMSLIAKDCGFRWQQRLSNLLHAPDGVPASTTKNFERIARMLRYPVNQIFANTDEAPRLVNV